MTGTGKTIFDHHIYKQLSEKNTSKEINFVFFDMTRVNFLGWKSPYLLAPVTVEADEAMAILEKLSSGKVQNKKIFVHIEECDMFYVYPKKMERTIKEIIEKRPDVCFVYSTSRPDPNHALTKGILTMADVKVVFELATKQSLQYILGRKAKQMPQRWEKIVVYGSEQVLLKPLSVTEVEELQNFQLS